MLHYLYFLHRIPIHYLETFPERYIQALLKSTKLAKTKIEYVNEKNKKYIFILKRTQWLSLVSFAVFEKKKLKAYVLIDISIKQLLFKTCTKPKTKECKNIHYSGENRLECQSKFNEKLKCDPSVMFLSICINKMIQTIK